MGVDTKLRFIQEECISQFILKIAIFPLIGINYFLRKLKSAITKITSTTTVMIIPTLTPVLKISTTARQEDNKVIERSANENLNESVFIVYSLNVNNSFNAYNTCLRLK